MVVRMKTATVHIFLFIFGVLMVKTLASPISKADFLDELLGTLETVLEEESGSSFARKALREHNSYRSRHGSPPLSLDSDLSAGAEYWARVIASKGDLEHSSGPEGENLSIQCSDGKSAVESWYNEKSDYNYGYPGYSDATGHFTQVIWKGSKRLGIGKARGKFYSGGTYYDCDFIVARYLPRGNIAGAFPENVQRG